MVYTMVRPSPLLQAWRLVKCAGDALQAPKEGWQENVAYLCVRLDISLREFSSSSHHSSTLSSSFYLSSFCLIPTSSPLHPQAV